MKNIGGRPNLYHCPCFHPLAPSDQHVVSMISSDQEKEVAGSGKKKRSSPRRSFTRLVRAVISETAMRRKSKKIQQDPYQALRNLSCVPKSKSMREEESNSRKSSSLTSSITSTSSSSCSSASSSSLSNSSSVSFGSKSFGSSSSGSSSRFLGLDDSKQSNSEETVSKQGHSTNELWWVVLSLVVLIFFGRICAIICTLTWIYYGPFRRGRRNEQVTKREQMQKQGQVQEQEENLDSREYKKRVVMGGFLERRHSRY